MSHHLTILEAFTVSLFLVIFGILGIASKIQNKLRAVRKVKPLIRRTTGTLAAGGSTMRGSRSTARKGECNL
jgi:hypothetical protein